MILKKMCMHSKKVHDFKFFLQFQKNFMISKNVRVFEKYFAK